MSRFLFWHGSWTVCPVMSLSIVANPISLTSALECYIITLEDKRQFENKSVGVFAWVFPLGRAGNTHEKLDTLDKSAGFQNTFRRNIGSDTRHPTFIKLTLKTRNSIMRWGFAGLYTKRTSIMRLKLDSERENTPSANPMILLPRRYCPIR